MARAASCVFHIVINTFILFIINPSLIFAENDELSIVGFDFDSFHGDYTPPSPPPPASPPHPPSLSCEGDLGGIGSFDTLCVLNSSLVFEEDVYIEGAGNLHILSGVIFSCPAAGCSILVNISGDFVMGVNSSIIAGSVHVFAQNVSMSDGSMINVTALAGAPPAQTSGTPSGVQGSGGGHGGRGACCVTDNTKLPEDVWGGDAYSWSTLDEPRSYGSKGGTTSKEEDYGGGGGGRIGFEVDSAIEVWGTLMADGGDGGVKGGGGSGGSIYMKAPRM